MQNLFDSTKKDFVNYLSSLGISQKSHKNYKSDIAHFLSWLKIRIKSFGSTCETLDQAIPFLKSSLAYDYKNELAIAGVPHKTINRRLSTLRHLSRFLTASQVLEFDFMDGIENMHAGPVRKIGHEDIMGEFRAHLEAEKASSNTIKNYLSDVRQFLKWLEYSQSN